MFPAIPLAEAHARMTAPGTAFEMEERLIASVPTRVWKHGPKTLRDVFTAGRAHGDKTFLVHEDDRASFDAFARAALAIAHALADAGVAKGDRVALAMRNLPEWPAAFFGAVLTGAIAVPLNAWWTAAELEYALQDSGAKLAIVDAERLARLAPALARCPGLQAVWVARSVGTLRHDDRRVRALHAITGAVADWPSLPDRPLPAVDLQPDDDATIFYTSGTTGQPKGALGSHRNATTCIVAAGFSPQRNFVRRGEPVPRPEDRRTQRASLVGIPFFHVTGCFAWLGPALTTGGKLVTLHRWDTERAFALIERERCTQAGGVPTLAWQLLEHPARGSYDLSSLESLSYGGAPAGAELVRRIHDVFPAAVAGIGWGMTETTATFTHQGAEDYLQRPDSCGPALPVCDMQVVDGAGRALPAGQVGELWARGPNIVKGYWNKEQATAETFVDGWVRTGDIARIDHEGFLFIVDRKKDMLIRGGENIYCVEVEDALYAHPAVMDAGVVGLPHRTLGEEPAAVVTLKPGTDATEDALRDWVRGRLAPFKVPVRVMTLREPLPRNANGKIIKKALLPLFSDTTAPCNNEELRMATDFVKTTVDAGIAVLTMDKPPVNGLGFELRTAIAQALDAALADADVQAIVLTGTARAFSGGADVTEFGTPKTLREPMLRSLIAMLEDSPKPVVAAIAGSCLGGGLELAMGAHFRVAAADAQLGLPEVKLGLLPGSGGTQRLPRLLGPGGLEMALNMIVGGAAVAASDLRGTALIDGIADGDVVTAAVAFAHKAVADKLPLRRARDLKVQDPQAEAFLQFARNTVGAASKNFPAPLKCVEVVGLALTKPFDDALRLEREAFLALMQTPESRALRHVFAAERAAGKIDGLPDAAALRTIASVGVIGAGTMGGGIAMNFLNAGLSVVLLETKQEALDKGVATIRRNYESTLKKGKLTQPQLDERMALLTPTLDYAGFANVDLVVEAVFENMDVKQQVFRTLDEVCKPGAILASNTSYLNVDTIAGFTKRQADVLGLHFFSPANVMRLLEVVRGAKTAPDVLATCMALAKKIRKVAVVSGVCDGFIGNRMLARYGAAAAGLIDAGALPQQVDAALQQFGMAMGPFRVGDLAGLDIGWATRKRRAAEAGVEHKPIVADKLCEAGRFGQKTGAGWYRYAAGQRDPLPDPVVEGLIAQYRQDNRLMPRKISGDEIVQRCVYALVNEGARILEEGIAARASDIDLVYLNGYGFPLHRGGPMLYADTVGLPNVVRALRRFAAEPGADASWQPAPLLLRLAEEGRTFN